MMENELGIRNIKTGIGSAGVGFVVIPDGVDIESYIKDCYRTHTVTINGGTGYGFFSAVHVDVNVMQNIHFPLGEEKRGSAVVWVKDSVSQLPVIVGNLRYQDGYYYLEENQWKTSRGFGDKNIEILMDGNTSTLQINIVGDETNPAQFDIKLSSKNSNSSFNISSDNDINVFSKNSTSITSNNKWELKITDKGEVKTSLRYETGKGLIYKDEFDNEVICENEKVTVNSKEIYHNSGKEPMVLGDTLSDILNDLITAIQKLTVVTPVGASSPPINMADFATIKGKIENIKSKKSKLE